jgi:DNA-binding NarL/FixJ family response regulator
VSDTFRPRVLLIENRPIVRLAIKTLLDGGDFEVMEAGTCAEALSSRNGCRPDVFLMGVELSATDGIEAATTLLRSIPGANIVQWFLESDDEAVWTAIQLGVRGIVCKTASLSDLHQALRAVALGGACYFGVPEQIFSAPNGGNGQHEHRLAPREMRVLRMIAQGKTSKEIAVALQLGVETVRFYRKSIMRKLGAHNVAGLLKAANAEGLIPIARSVGEL